MLCKVLRYTKQLSNGRFCIRTSYAVLLSRLVVQGTLLETAVRRVLLHKKQVSTQGSAL